MASARLPHTTAMRYDEGVSWLNRGGPYRDAAEIDLGDEPLPPSWEERLQRLRRRRRERFREPVGSAPASTERVRRVQRYFLRKLAELAALQDGKRGA